MIDGAFPAEVVARWPSLLRTLGISFTCLSIRERAGALLQTNPSSFTKTYPAVELLKRLVGKGAPAESKAAKAKDVNTASEKGPSILSLVFSPKFALLWIMILNSAVSGLNIASSYKTYAAAQPQQQQHSSRSTAAPQHIALTRSPSCFCTHTHAQVRHEASPPQLGHLPHPRRRPSCHIWQCGRTLLLGVAIGQTRLQGLLQRAYTPSGPHHLQLRPSSRLRPRALPPSHDLYALLHGRQLCDVPRADLPRFGAQGASVYSFLFTGFGFAALLGPILSTYLLSKGGYPLVFTTLSLMSALSFILCRLFL